MKNPSVRRGVYEDTLILPRVESESQVEIKQVLENTQYSNSNKTNLNYSNSTVKPSEVLRNIPDLVHEGYEPFYVSQLKRLGYKRFMELVSKARAGSDSPQKLFSWMLKNNEIVR